MTSRDPYTETEVREMLDAPILRLRELTEVFNVLLEKYGTAEEEPHLYSGAVDAAVASHDVLNQSATRIRMLRTALKQETQILAGILTWENRVNRTSEVKLARATRMSRTTIRALLRSGPPKEERR